MAEQSLVTAVFAVSGVSCPSCVGKIQQAFKEQEGLVAASFDFPSRRLELRYETGALEEAEVVEAMAVMGYQANRVA